ncbi:Acyl transferase domain-containing protein [Nitrosomonas sp. Nm51]|uniref:type I polyketide synthase n=1 Tax=Nitrosomonas sp. Nm51 TaxID=133720 RepID=UPI0008AD4187|nr:type I polyketide synthase [Nitrosomonas sp. Nm51]SEQ75095.1 Acyl transferase domain-containing protein [Nitrosomonas sp. Nm51]
MQKPANTLSRNSSTEPLAIIGIGCRYAGDANDPESFWQLLLGGKDAISDIPPDRWNLKRFYDPDSSKPGKIYTHAGGFLKQKISEFDALFFGITPREAECMDPQQRLLLETSWEALEDAGIPIESIAGSNTGVFIGAFTLDHKLTQMGSTNRDFITTHTAIGSTMTILSNRISYMLDLHGPSMSLDTACSSSLVATHLACQSIWQGECNLALVGGVNIMFRPEYPVAMCKGGFLARDGRSKSFDENADGYGRGEGAGVVVLKSLSEALKDGDSIYALIRGTGVNQDGRTNGITVPNPEAQSALIREVCNKYQLDPKKICYFEAHGTGTPVGDPLEAQALGAVIGQGRSQKNACFIGSVKSTIGHTEAAAGVAGMIKAALCLSHRQVPPQANLKNPNPNIPFKALGLRLPRKIESLAPNADQLFAGVNSFGYGGTNAHVILENAPINPNIKTIKPEQNKAPYILPLSARSDSGLSALAQSWLDRFSETGSISLDDLCYSASCRRSHHNHRLAAVGSTFTEIRTQLEQFVSQGAGEWLAQGKTLDNEIKNPVFVFTGMGPQWWAMGRELYASESVFREAVDTCDTLFFQLAGWSIRNEILADEEQSRITKTTIAQPANFVIQVGLAALLRAYGVEPAAIVGHSVGEVTAAYVSGVLTLEEAIQVSYYRSQIQNKAAGQGRMLAVGINYEQCQELLDLTENKVSIAAINGPTSITLAGDSNSLEAISTYLTAINEFNRFLKVEVAYHSHYMDALKPEVREKLAQLSPSLPSIPLYSTVTGDLVDDIACDAEYWCNNIRKPVYFAKAMESLLKDGHRVFLEVGPHPVLSTAIKECCSARNIPAQTAATLKRGAPEQLTFKLGMAGLYTAGCNLNWRRLYAENAQYIKLPTYPWQREIYWHEMDDSVSKRTNVPAHPILDQRLRDPRPSWQGTLNHQFIPYLKDHKVDGLVVMPGAAYIEAGIAAHNELAETAEPACLIENIHFHHALILESINDPTIHINLDEHTGEYSFFSKKPDELMNWQLHASGIIKKAKTSVVKQTTAQLEKNFRDCDENVDIDYLYQNLRHRGLDYGPHFRTIRQLRRGKNKVFAQIQLHDQLLDDLSNYYLHPCLLDGCFQSLIALVEDDEQFFMPVSISEITFHKSPGKMLWCQGRLLQRDSNGIIGSLALYDENGSICAKIEGLFCKALQNEKENPHDQLSRYAHAWKWYPQNLESRETNAGCWVVFSDNSLTCNALCTQLETEPGNTVFQIKLSDIFQENDPVIRPLDCDQVHHLKAILNYVKDKSCVGVAYLWGLNPHEKDNDPTGIGQTSAALQVLQCLSDIFTSNVPRLYFVTQGVNPVIETDTVTHLAQSSLIGLIRVAHNEFPDFKCTTIDLDTQHSYAAIEQLKTELLVNSAEDDVALRNLQRFVHRLERIEIPDNYFLNPAVPLNGTQVEAFQVDPGNESDFSPITRVRPKANEVEIAVSHFSLASAIADQNRENSSSGFFAAGNICSKGKNISQLNQNDRVLIAANHTPASHCTIPVKQVFSTAEFKKITSEELVALATSMLPAYYLLRYLTSLTEGETVIVDAQTGIPASALTNICKWLNLDLIYYSDNSQQIKLLESFKSITVLNASKPGFGKILMNRVGTCNMGAWIHAGSDEQPGLLKILKTPGTREIIINQTNAQQPALSKKTNVMFYSPDGLNIALSSPGLFTKLLSELAQFVNQYSTEPGTAYPVSPEKSFKTVFSKQFSDNLFTPVVSLKDKASISLINSNTNKFDPKATYLITGGFGGFGLESARWLAKHGAKYLVLLGRRGAASKTAIDTVALLRKQGVKVMEVAADICDNAQINQLIEKIKQEFPALKGILHTAAVLDDAPINELNPCRLSTVMQAKAVGAWNLHQITQKMPLDFFVLFSSVSGLIGNSRQANYSAANTFLDTLAWYRNARGLPATSINWGAIAAGMAVDNDEVKKHLENMGISPLTSTQALDSWMHMSNMNLPQYGLMDTNWPRWQAFEPMGGNSPRYSKLMLSDSSDPDHQMTSICQEISQLPADKQLGAMSAALCEQIAKTLCIPADKIELQHSLTQLGVDSLMAADLQTTIYQTFGVRISALELLRGNNLSQTAKMIFDKSNISRLSEPEETGLNKDSVVAQLTDEDVDVLLKQLMS